MFPFPLREWEGVRVDPASDALRSETAVAARDVRIEGYPFPSARGP
jgi:hypothetical protein